MEHNLRKRSNIIAWIIGYLLTFQLFSANAQSAVDAAAILDGVHEVAAPGLTGSVCAVGPRSTVLVCGATGRNLVAPVVAASVSGASRVVILGHTGFLESEGLAFADTGRLVINALKWAGGTNPRIGTRGLSDLSVYLKSQGIDTVSLDGPHGLDHLSDVTVLACPLGELKASESAQVAGFLKRGGGLVSAETGWGWQQVHGGASLTLHPGNRLLESYGLLWTDGTVGKTNHEGLTVGVLPDNLSQASRALDAVIAWAKTPDRIEGTAIDQPFATLTSAVRSLPASDRFLRPKLKSLCNAFASGAALKLRTPLRNSSPLERLVLTLLLIDESTRPAEKVRADPAAESFPGLVPVGAPRIERTVRIDTAIPDWHSTGLYAAPGELVRVVLPTAVVGKGLKVRIGSHTDELWSLPTWERAPQISREYALDREDTPVANAFGGAIYVVVPRGSRLGAVEVKIHHAVEAPYYVRGVTSVEDWRKKIRNAPGPWAELQANNVILTVPSSAVRSLEDPESLLAYWDAVSDNCADLYSISRNRLRPERYCVDRQISAGYMHSGYPIMTGPDVAGRFTDVTTLRGSKGILAWGFYHEIGHNHQISDWTFEGTGEVTNNLHSLYSCEKLNGVSPDDYGKAHPALTPETVQKRLAAYIAKGAPFEQWQSDPWLALTMYIELRQAFGWEPFKQVFAGYHHIPGNQHPQTEIEKHDQWMVRFSQAVNRNLGPFFQAWGVPTSEKARESVAQMPVWMPDDFPHM